MFELFTQGFTLLNFISFIAFITTVALFFCGLPICRQIWKRKDTAEISGAPFLMGIVGGTCWMAYGHLKNDETVNVVTSCQVVLYTSYTIYYWIMTKKKFWITLKVLAVACQVGGLFTIVHLFGMKIFYPLGVICLTLNAADFAAPLAGLGIVIRRRATSTLPLPLCIANFLVSTEWFIYGLLKKDFFLITPNGIGSFLAVIQLLLFVFLPRKPGQRSPIIRLFRFCSGKRNDDQSDISPQILEEDIEKKMTLPHKFTQKAISTVTNMAEELENVIHMVGHDQFAYVQKIDDEDTPSEKTIDSKKAPLYQIHDFKRMASVRHPIELAPHSLKRSLSSPSLC